MYLIPIGSENHACAGYGILAIAECVMYVIVKWQCIYKNLCIAQALTSR